MNRGAVRTQAAIFCGDPDQTRYTTTQYNDAINRAQDNFAAESRALWKDVTWTTVSGTAAYAFSAASSDISSDFQYEDWVMFDGSELSPMSRHELQRLTRGDDWTDDSGAPTHFIIDPEQAQRKIRLYPIPDSAKTLTLRYYPLPAELSSDSDIPFNSSTLMTRFHLGIAAFAAWLLIMGEVQTPPLAAKQAKLLALYSDAVDKAIDTFKNTMSMGIRIKGSRVWR